MSKYSSFIFERKFDMTPEHKKITIWKSYHDESQKIKYNLFENERIYLFNTTNLGYSGKNINQLNRFFCEGVCILYPYLNNLKSDLIGFQHYRRWYHSNLNKLKINEISKGKVQIFHNRITNEPIKILNNQHVIYVHFSFWMEKDCGFYNDCIEYLKCNYPEYLTTPQHNYTFHGYSQFVCNWEKYIKLCDLLWGYLNFISDKYSFDFYSENDWVEFIKEHFILYNRIHNIPARVIGWGLDNWYNDDYLNNSNAFYYYRIFSYNIEFLISCFANIEGYIFDKDNQIHRI